MDALETMKTWLMTFPLWEDSMSLDYLPAAPGNAGLFSQGMLEISRKRDVLGNVTVKNRLRFLLRRVTPGQQGGFLLYLQEWIQQQSILGLAPVFGEDPARETITAQQGKLSATPQSGTGLYTVELTVDYLKFY